MTAPNATDADRAEDAELFLVHWPGGKRLTTEDRADFIAGWTGWHAGVDFAHECDVRDRLAAPAPLDPDNPGDWRQVADFIESMAVARDWEEPDRMKVSPLRLREEAERIDRQRAKAEQHAADRQLAEDVADEVWSREESAWHIAQKAAQATLLRVRAERARVLEGG